MPQQININFLCNPTLPISSNKNRETCGELLNSFGQTDISTELVESQCLVFSSKRRVSNLAIEKFVGEQFMEIPKMRIPKLASWFCQ
jgi:hypothetical protein